jgi:hypothetical protein
MLVADFSMPSARILRRACLLLSRRFFWQASPGPLESIPQLAILGPVWTADRRQRRELVALMARSIICRAHIGRRGEKRLLQTPENSIAFAQS